MYQQPVGYYPASDQQGQASYPPAQTYGDPSAPPAGYQPQAVYVQPAQPSPLPAAVPSMIVPIADPSMGSATAPVPSNVGMMQGVQNDEVVAANVELLQKYRSVKDMSDGADWFQTMYSTFLIFINAYSLVISSLLTVFVPQQCDPTADTNFFHQCSTNETMKNLSGFAKFVLAWNFITLGMGVLLHWVVWHRERYLIKNFDVNQDKSRVNMLGWLRYFPELDEGLHIQNRRTKIFAMIWITSSVTNIILSAIIIMHNRYLDTTSVTTFITSLCVVGTLAYRSYEISAVSLRHGLALSCLQFDPISYNVLDKRYSGQPNQALYEKAPAHIQHEIAAMR